ncbi:hypothetical protein OUZ56_005605 [Daphnia magna]|uniref:Retrotransposon gag domain-containing protein n=1 Tax=Daphnia magna TaxID=35525 RepID=A0ABQ9YT84_9CRUS|nr:hypothetical protein OUZ56_005605 [Daphnia magna]
MQASGSVTIFCDRQSSGRFDGWAAQMQSALDLGNFDEARKLRLMRSKLYGEAAEEFETFKLDIPIRSQEYAAVKARLFKLFHSTETRSQRSVQFHNMKREPEENMRRYANRIRKAFHIAYPMDGILDSATAASREQMMMDRFLEGLSSDVQVPLQYKKFASFETLIDRAELTALAIEESQTRVKIHAAYSSTNATTHQNGLTSVLEALNRFSTKVPEQQLEEKTVGPDSTEDVVGSGKRVIQAEKRLESTAKDLEESYVDKSIETAQDSSEKSEEAELEITTNDLEESDVEGSIDDAHESSDGSEEEVNVDSADEEQLFADTDSDSGTGIMPPQIKILIPKVLKATPEDDAFDWLERYESTGAYNQWGDTELRASFTMYLDGQENGTLLHTADGVA